MGGQGFEMSFQQQLTTQSWSLYGVGMFVILLRTYARWRRAGSASLLAPDDWLMMTAVPAFYTILIVCLNVIATGGGSNMFLPEEFDTFTEEDIKERIKGSKIVLVSEQGMLNVIWTLKACMLFMYARMTQGTRHRKYIQWLAIYVALGWVAVEVTFFTACRPFQGYWGVPPPDPQCTTYQHYAIVQAVFNLSSDFGILIVPLPVIASLTLPLKQKIVLGIVFSMGAFVIIAAILTKYYNLSDVYDTAYMLWYIREASVAILVANLPGIWPLLREHVCFLRSNVSHGTGSTHLPRFASKYGQSSKVTRSRITTRPSPGSDDDIELGPTFSKLTSRSMKSLDVSEERKSHFGRKLGDTRRGSLESDERALNDLEGGGWGKLNLEVHVDKTIEVHEHRASRDQSRGLGMGVTGVEAPKTTIEGPEGEVVNKPTLM
ncbi:hypothetical protein K458DRAFT_390591 [Lentithecium fluviatile CBS 122367]|uniref:Rhodopsin domain-containing protein n=1 Tax=Lentithecium fluviatile CBS 122367 TaxID=1168545 RepID=A0A6G1IXQ0_9PLEO|nr:hypothetical protein K458DRAFT_390591 [Lentithecium fluviatile CBS 122367]